MDAAERKQRASALEEKRRRLEELKKARSRRAEDTAKVRASATANLDDYIDGLLASQPTGIDGTASKDEGEPAQPHTAVEKAADDKSTASAASNVIAEPAPAPPPKLVETFTIATQTDEEEFPEVLEVELDEEDNPEEREKLATAETEETAVDVPVEEEKEPKLLSTEEVQKEISSGSFPSFINTASKKVERMLGAPFLGDLLVDYVGQTDGVERETKDSDESRYLSSRQVFECPKWTATRDVTDLDWSPLHRELILSTYHMPNSTTATLHAKGSTAVSAISPDATNSSSLTPRSGELLSDGLALVWSLTMPTRPEHIFTCGSPVLTGRFHPTEPTLVIGGCESGQIVVWDVRAGRLPVQKSAFTTVTGASSKGHTHPIGNMEIIQGGVSTT
jgi:dynein intermediate chain